MRRIVFIGNPPNVLEQQIVSFLAYKSAVSVFHGYSNSQPNNITCRYFVLVGTALGPCFDYCHQQVWYPERVEVGATTTNASQRRASKAAVIRLHRANLRCRIICHIETDKTSVSSQETNPRSQILNWPKSLDKADGQKYYLFAKKKTVVGSNKGHYFAMKVLRKKNGYLLRIPRWPNDIF
jgi:hypothetical protein